MVLCLVGFFVFIGMTVWAEEESIDREISEKLIAQIDDSSLIQETFIVSPDSKRVAYGAIVGNKWFVVMDGKEDKQYDDIVILGGGKIVFDSADSLHYLALKGNSIYLVEEKMK